MVRKLELSLAVGRYAITMPLVDGSVQVQGAEVTPLVLPSPERHWRMLRHREFDVCETSIAGYLRAVEEEPDAWTAIPVFPHRRFRHGYVFVADAALVGHPDKLAGGRIGLRTWGTSAGVWLRGILQDDHGIDLTAVRWVTEHAEHVPGGDLARFDITSLPEGRGLVDMLLAGDLDALVYPEVPKVADGASGKIHRLFPDPRQAEIDYFRRRANFPIMHTVALPRALAEAHPWLPNSLVAAFEAAKQDAYRRMRDPRWAPMAWSEPALEEQDEVLGADPWVYGYQPNADTLQTVVRLAHEQGLISSTRDPQEYFWPSTLDRPPAYRAARGH